MITRVIRVFILSVIFLRGDDSVNATSVSKDVAPSNPFLASVRKYPHFLHKCMATFITPTALVATAACLLCDRHCKLFIRVIKDDLEDSNTAMYKVNKTVVNPNYHGDDGKFDIGIIFLEKPATDVRLMELPSEDYIFSGITARLYVWLFTEDKQKYNLHELTVQTISNEICSAYLSEYVPSRYLCVLSKTELSLGSTDLGSPVISNGTYMLGIFDQHRAVEDTRIAHYESIFPFIGWIKGTLKANTNLL